MSFDNLIKIATLVISVIITVNSFSKLEKNKKLSDDYFEKVLSVYVKKYKCSANINPLNFVKRRFDISDYFIPSYIFYLVDKGEKEKLHKILIIDYREKFPSETNTIFEGMNKMITIASFILLLTYSLVMVLAVIIGGFLIISSAIDIIFSRIGINSLKAIISSIFIFSIGIILRFVFISFIHDEYTMKNKIIEKIVKRKEKNFDKNKDKYYID